MIHYQIANLLNAIKRFDPPPNDCVHAITALPPPGALPMPATTFLLFLLVQKREESSELKSTIQALAPKLFRGRVEMSAQVDRYQVKRCGWAEYLSVRDTTSNRRFAVNISTDDHYVFYDPIEVNFLNEGLLENRCRELLDLHNQYHQAFLDLIAGELIEPHTLNGLTQPLEKFEFASFKRLFQVHERQIIEFMEFYKTGENRLWLSSLLGDWECAYALCSEMGEVPLVVANRVALLRRLAKCHTNTFNAYQEIVCGVQHD